ncbi:hypothetical protein ACFE04_024816 [Oxalis oulophora]
MKIYKDDDDDNNDDDEDDDEDTGAQIAPIIKLEEVAVSTGEENEDALLDLEALHNLEWQDEEKSNFVRDGDKSFAQLMDTERQPMGRKSAIIKNTWNCREHHHGGHDFSTKKRMASIMF